MRMTCWCWFIVSNSYITLVRDFESLGGCAYMGAGHTRQISGLSTLFHCESRTTLKKKKKSVQTNKQTKSLYLLLNSRKCFIAFPMLLKLEVLSPAPFYLCTFISSCSFLSPAFCFPSTFISFRLEWFVPSPSSGLGPASPPCLLSVYPSCRPELILISWRLRGDPCLSSRFCHIFPKVFWLLLLGLSYKNQASSPEPLSLLYLDIPNNEYSCLLFNIALLH